MYIGILLASSLSIKLKYSCKCYIYTYIYCVFSESMDQLLDVQLGLLRQADGSSLFKLNSTSVMVGVYGPTEVKPAKELSDRASLEVTYKPKVKQAGCREKLLEKNVQSAFDGVVLTELHPRTAIQVIIQELQDSGSLYSCCINGVCFALLDACVPMRSTLAAVTCAVDSEGEIIIFPTKRQEETAIAVLSAAFESKEGAIISLSSSGVLTESKIQDCITVCKSSCSKIFELYRNKMRQLCTKNAGSE